MSKKYIIHAFGNNPNPFIVKDKLYDALLQTQFIEEIIDFSRPIEVLETGKNASLDKVTIDIKQAKELNIEKIWRVNLEKEIIGISSKNYFKTPEVALLFLQKKKEQLFHLHIILVEMKSSLNDTSSKKKSDKSIELRKGELETIPEKFQAGMNRMYMFLAIQNIENQRYNYHTSSISLDFKGLIFYGANQTSSKSANLDLYNMLQNPASNNLLTCESVLENQDKIRIHFSSKPSTKLQEFL